jgi:hypothetical protein
MKLGPDPRCKEQPPLAEDLRKKIPRAHSVVSPTKLLRWSGPSSESYLQRACLVRGECIGVLVGEGAGGGGGGGGGGVGRRLGTFSAPAFE